MADYANEAATLPLVEGRGRLADGKSLTLTVHLKPLDMLSPLDTHAAPRPPFRAFIVDTKMRLENVAEDATTRPAAKKSATCC